MKGFAGLVLGVLLVLPYAPLRAQQQDKLEVTRAVVQAERKMIVAANLGLSESESAPFWVVYNEYHGQITKLNDGLIKLVSDLAKEFETLTDDRSVELLDQYMSFREDRLELRRKFKPKFAEVLPGKKLVRYYQIENKLDTIIDFDLARAIPLTR